MSVRKLNLLFTIFILYSFFVAVSSGSNDTKKRVYGRGGLISLPPSFLRTSDIIIDDVADFIPEHFDAREKWPQCPSIGTIQDQGDCDSCWAVASASAMTDRWCIDSNGRDQFEFSAGDLLTCCPNCHGGEPPDPTMNRCQFGGNPFRAVKYWMSTGIASGSGRFMKGCKPYSTIVQEQGGAVDGGKCKESCTNPDYNITYDKDKRSGKDVRFWFNDLSSIEVLQTEIMRFGPVTGSMNSTKHFAENGGKGIYSEPKDKPKDSEVSPHAIKIIGWGVEDGKQYWQLANSWGPDWGAEKGFFKLLRGVNQLGIEQDATIPSIKERPKQKRDDDDDYYDVTYRPRPRPRYYSAASLLNNMNSFHFMIFKIFMYFYV